MTEKSNKKPVLLCILDGFGIGDEKDENNAILKAKMLNYQRILSEYPVSRLETSGLAVGLPEGQMGNSEVGHMAIGSGRVIFQDLVRINRAVESDELKKNQDLAELLSDLKESGKKLHLCGLFSDGGVHSSQEHIFYLAKVFAENGVEVNIHAFLDGRDVAQKSVIKNYREFLKECGHDSKIKIVSVCGRYYAMDRDNKWDRIKISYDGIVSGKTDQKKNYQAQEFEKLINDSYEEGIFDEFVKPHVFQGYEGIENGDGLIFCNFRADRARQISSALVDENFDKFETKKIKFSSKLSLTSYSERLDKFYKVLFKSIEIKNGLAEILSKNKKTQLRIAETEKYAHVTFFFSGGQEGEFEGEKRILVDSPNVKTYDLKPEMSAGEVSEKLVDKINSGEFDFIVVNYANPDMVGHSGNLEASIKACQVIDEKLSLLEKAILAKDGTMFITADHGNIECMKDENGQPHTSHTTNLVPFIFIDNKKNRVLKDGDLSDIAPTILEVMNLEKPREMSGESLFG